MPESDITRQLLTISNVGWEEVRGPFLQEALAREVQFILPRYPKYFPTLPDEENQARCLLKYPTFSRDLQLGVWWKDVPFWTSEKTKTHSKDEFKMFSNAFQTFPNYNDITSKSQSDLSNP